MLLQRWVMITYDEKLITETNNGLHSDDNDVWHERQQEHNHGGDRSQARRAAHRRDHVAENIRKFRNISIETNELYNNKPS